MIFPLALAPLLLLAAPPAVAPGNDTSDSAALRRECRTAAQCTARGVLYYKGDGKPKDPAKAAVFYRFGCDEGDVGGCYNLADLYASGVGVAVDNARWSSSVRPAPPAPICSRYDQPRFRAIASSDQRARASSSTTSY
jgi:hypothetical protein